MNAIAVRTLIVLVIATATTATLKFRGSDREAPESLSAESEKAVLGPDWPSEVLNARSAAKFRLAEDLVARRRNLWEVAALFREINNYPHDAPAGDLPERGPITHVPRSGEERLCMQVLHYVAASLHQRPELRREELSRLERVFLDALQANGVISLPDTRTLTPVEQLVPELALLN